MAIAKPSTASYTSPGRVPVAEHDDADQAGNSVCAMMALAVTVVTSPRCGPVA